MDQQAIGFRRATEPDQPAIRALVHGERLNPIGINWPNFLVADIGGRIVGAAQIRKHSDGSRELGSLVVAKDMRGHGIASRLVDALLAEEREPVWLITPESRANIYHPWGFQPIEPAEAPVKVRHNYRMGRLASVISLLLRRPIRRLVILERLPVERRTVGRTAPAKWIGHEPAIAATGP
jgi:amino-acid N-acetyltransferase